MTAQGYTGPNVSMGDVEGLDAELTDVRADFAAGDASVLYTASLAYDASQAATATANNALPKAGGVVEDSTLEVRKSDGTSGVRLRATGGAVDIDKRNGDIVVSSFAGPGYAGTQTGLQRWRATGSTFAGLTEFDASVYGGAQYVDGANGKALFNQATGTGMDTLRIRGRKPSTGAPTTGTWVTGDAIMDSAKVWWYCTAGGTPGTWS